MARFRPSSRHFHGSTGILTHRSFSFSSPLSQLFSSPVWTAADCPYIFTSTQPSACLYPEHIKATSQARLRLTRGRGATTLLSRRLSSLTAAGSEIWQCGDGVCQSPDEYPALGRFGCALDCGENTKTTQISIKLEQAYQVLLLDWFCKALNRFCKAFDQRSKLAVQRLCHH
eukprot:600377-Rhodomonas_salina.1